MKGPIRNLLLALIYPRPFIGLVYIPRFIVHWFKFSRLNSGRRLRLRDVYPSLGDWVAKTPFDAHYFFQAAWLSRHLAATNPQKHVDIGSDTKLIGVISAFVDTEFLDFRPIDVMLPGLVCRKADILKLDISDSSVRSLSCLHVIEHIGLGRYGDEIDPDGSRKALAELERVVAPGGVLFLSVPVGRERVCFNAHRVFASEAITEMLPNMRVESFSLVDDAGRFHANFRMEDTDEFEYGCGLFVLRKVTR